MFDAIWIEKYRPKTFDEILLTEENRKAFQHMKDNGETANLLFVGPPGIGKTSLAKILATDILDCQYLYLNGSDAGIDTVRHDIISFAQTQSFDDKHKLVIVDEADGFSGTGQRSLRNTMEEFAHNTRFILTANYKYRIIGPLQSRCQYYDLVPTIKDMATRCAEILKAEGISLDKEKNKKIIELVKAKFPDLRTCINVLQKASISGELVLDNVNVSNEFVNEILGYIKAKQSLQARKAIIRGEREFQNDYDILFRSFFDAICESKDVDENIAKQWLVIIAKYMYQSKLVMDQEVNCYACLIEMESIL